MGTLTGCMLFFCIECKCLLLHSQICFLLFFCLERKMFLKISQRKWVVQLFAVSVATTKRAMEFLFHTFFIIIAKQCFWLHYFHRHYRKCFRCNSMKCLHRSASWLNGFWLENFNFFPMHFPFLIEKENWHACWSSVMLIQRNTTMISYLKHLTVSAHYNH